MWKNLEAGEVAERLKALAEHEKAQGSIPRTHKELISAYNFKWRGSDAFF